MIWIAASAYFAVACAVLAWCLLPPLRGWTTAHVGRLRDRFVGSGQAATHAVRREARAGVDRAHDSARTVGTWVHAHRWLLAGVVALLCLPPSVVFSLRAFHALDAYDDTTTPSSEGALIATLLQGEQLVPPPPLPPEVFATAAVERERPQLGRANRQWELLDPTFRRLLLVVYHVMKEEHGYEMVLLEGYRSPERQAELAALGPHVTRAGAGHSRHQQGRAADSAFLRNGHLVISERDPWAMRGYTLFGEVAQRVGLTWGGHWTMRDLGHVETPRDTF